jgi:tetratricopeptide (TPR) repeat protein
LLGRAYLTEGRAEDALASYRRALALEPDDPALLNNVAWLLATDPTPEPGSAEEAVRFAEQAARAAPDAASHDTLAASLAAAGRFEEAQQTALRAVHEAREQGDDATAADIAKRLRGYAAGRRHVEGSPR